MKSHQFSLFLRFVLKSGSLVLEGFDIEFLKLKDGEHNFHYNLKGEFFEAFENSEVQRANIAVEALLDRQTNFIQVNLQMNGTLGLGCDRCLEAIDFPVHTSYAVVFELQAEYHRRPEMDDSGDVEMVKVSHQESVINFSRQVYESILLQIPMIRNCDELEEKACNEEMLQKLKELNQNVGKGSDPRWDKLKDLLK